MTSSATHFRVFLRGSFFGTLPLLPSFLLGGYGHGTFVPFAIYLGPFMACGLGPSVAIPGAIGMYGIYGVLADRVARSGASGIKMLLLGISHWSLVSIAVLRVDESAAHVSLILTDMPVAAACFCITVSALHARLLLVANNLWRD